MKMKTKIACVILGVFTIVGTAFAYGGKHGGAEKRIDRMFEHVEKKLSLDSGQTDKLMAAKQAAIAYSDAMREHKRAMRESVAAIVSGETMNQPLALDHFTAKADVIRDQSPAMVAALADFYDSLNAEQQEEVRKVLEKKSQRKHKRKGHDQ
ncbi:Spy/CpxP family protein refolding chaperone [Eionea flava]